MVSQQVASLTKQADEYQALLKDLDVSSSPELSAAVKKKWIDVTCRAKQLNLSLLGIQDAALSKQLYDSCAIRLRKLPGSEGEYSVGCDSQRVESILLCHSLQAYSHHRVGGTFPAIPFDQSLPADKTAPYRWVTRKSN